MFAIKTFAIIIFFCVACTGLGSFLLRLPPFINSKKINKTSLRFLLLSYILGQGIFAFAFSVLAVMGIFFAGIILLLLLIPYVYAIFLLPKKLVQLFHEVHDQVNELFDFDAGWGLIAVICIAFLLGTFSTFGRPLDGDSATIYMSLPKLLSYSHQYLSLPGYVRINYAGGYSESIYAAFMTLGYRDSGRMNDLVIVLAISLVLLLIGKRLGIQKQGVWVILACLLTTSTFIYLICKGTADIHAVMLALASLFLILPEEKDFNRQEYFLAGVIGGLTAYARITYLLCFFPVLLTFILIRLFSLKNIHSVKEFLKSDSFKACLLFGVGILIGFSPLFIKDQAVFGNLFMAFMDGGYSYVSPDFQKDVIGKIIRAFPFDLFYGSFSHQYGRLTSLILAFFPLVFLTRIFRKPFSSNLLLQVTIAAFVGISAWMIFRPAIFVLRYFLAPLLLLSFIPAYSIESLVQSTKHRFLQIIILGALAILLVSEFSSHLDYFFKPKDTIDYLSGSLIECNKDLFYCKSLKAINKEAKPGDRVLFASWFNYHLRPDLLQCMVSEADGQVYRLTPQSLNPPIDSLEKTPRPTFNDLWQQIYERGFKYLVLITNPEALPGQLDMEKMSQTPWVKLTPLYSDEKVNVYRIEYSSPPSNVRVKCTETSPNVWQLVENN